MFYRTGTEALRPRPHLRVDAAESIDLDAHDQALLAGLAVWVLVHPEEPFREFVGVGISSGLRHRRGAVDEEIGLRFGTILNRDDDPGVALEVLRLLAPCGRVEQCLIALDVHPDHRHLRSPIRVERDDVTVRLVLQHFLCRLRQRDRHGALQAQGLVVDCWRPTIGASSALAARTGSKYSRRNVIFPAPARRNTTYSWRYTRPVGLIRPSAFTSATAAAGSAKACALTSEKRNF